MPIVSFGGCSKPLSEQGIGATKKHDEFSRAVTLLLIQGIITDGEARRARNRILKRIASDYAIRDNA